MLGITAKELMLTVGSCNDGAVIMGFLWAEEATFYCGENFAALFHYMVLNCDSSDSFVKSGLFMSGSGLTAFFSFH